MKQGVLEQKSFDLKHDFLLSSAQKCWRKQALSTLGSELADLQKNVANLAAKICDFLSPLLALTYSLTDLRMMSILATALPNCLDRKFGYRQMALAVNKRD
ncbi:MAG: hypothetical protein REI78_01835 [Pedobacter sp.]|nr:hypothetical protein [Pedobacter sp.]MDQ8051731.1 hypothetical protein [Pedobacter sp.]